MAGELLITYPGDTSTIYVIVRRVSDAKVWDVAGTAWATWSDAAIGDYDTAVPSVGGDMYQGDFPSSISSGTSVLIQYYLQAGASPSTNDSLLLTVLATWAGAILTASSSVALDTRALSTVASVKRALGIATSDTSSDTLITDLVNQVSDRIERETGRRFAAAAYHEWVEPHGEECATIRNWPIIRVDRVRYGTQDAVSLLYSGSGIEAYVSVYYDDEGGTGTLKLASISAAGTETSNTFAFATYPTLSTLVTAADAISGWAVSRTATRDGQSLSLYASGGTDAKNVTAYLAAVVDFDLVSKTNHRIGTIEMNRGYGPRLVSYRGGYETIPDDIAGVTNELVKLAYHEVSTNTLLAGETIPDYSYTLASRVDLTDRQRSILDAYRTFSIGGV